MPLVNAKCPNCGAQLQVDSSKDALICQYCGSAFIVEKAISNFNTTNNITAQTVNIYGGSGDFEIRAGKLLKYNGAPTEVVIPDNVVEIGDAAFKDCSGLKKVIIPNGVTKIGRFAFSHCSSLTAVNIPDSVTEIDYNAFEYCSALTSITLPGSLTNINKGAFWYSGLTSVVIPNGVTKIGGFAFSHCSSLTAVNIPSTVTEIDYNAFEGCSSLTEMVFPESVTHIHPDAFKDCGNLHKITILNSACKVGRVSVNDYDPEHIHYFPAFDSNAITTIIASEEWKRANWNHFPCLVSYKSGCYIATCVYGSYDCPSVWTLRRFRDDTLAETWYGLLFIRLYYAISPTIVKWFGHKEWFHRIWKKRLDKMVADLQHRGVDSTPYGDRSIF